MFFSNLLRPQRFNTDLVQAELGDAPLGPTQFIVLGGIASAEAFGTAKINEQIRLTGIVSAEAFGTAKINEQIRLTGIASAEAFGASKVIPVIRLTGIASAEAFGTAKINEQIRLTGIASAEAFGTAKINEQIRLSGIASAEAFGTAKINEQIRLTGIASAEAFGTAKINEQIRTTGIASAEAFGTAFVFPVISPTGIASAEAFGTAKINEQIRLTGIVSAEAFGVTTVAAVLAAVGIASAEAFGTAKINEQIRLSGIASAEAFGISIIVRYVIVTGIASAEAFGTVNVHGAAQPLVPIGIVSAEAFGNSNIAVGPVFILVAGIASAEAFGSARFLRQFSETVSDTLSVSEATTISKTTTQRVSEVLQILEDVGTGAFQIEVLSGTTLLVRLGTELRFEAVADLTNYAIRPMLGSIGVPATLSSVVPIYNTLHSGSSGLVVSVVTNAFFSIQFRIFANLTIANLGDYIQILNGQSVGLYQITSVLPQPVGQAYTEVLLDRPLSLGDSANGNLDWRHITGVQAIQVTTSKLTKDVWYDFSIKGVFTKLVRTPFQKVSTFYTQGISSPKVLSARFLPDGIVLVVFDQEMRPEAGGLFNASDYTITGSTAARVKRAFALNSNTVALETMGLAGGDYTISVTTTGTPKDIAGNPVDPIFNQVVFSSGIPVNQRSVFTDKGPIAKPPLTLQTGVGANIATYNEVALPGAALNSGHIGRFLTLSGTFNEGTYRITSIVSSTRARVQASFTLPDSGTLTWNLFDPRDGQIADDPMDVVVRVNGSVVVPDAVVGLLGQVVLSNVPGTNDDVKVDYSWVVNPTVDCRRLNSKEFRLNSWNVDRGQAFDTQHRYRYNNALVRPEEYVPDDVQSTLYQPLERELHYRAYERAYTAVLNDPTLLLLNSPLHKISYPPAQRSLVEELVAYEGVGLPEANSKPWIRKGSGTATSSVGVLTVVDDSSGTFPNGQPIFWTRPLDLSFTHTFAMSWRFSLDLVSVPEGVWTGVAAGYSNTEVAIVIGFLDVAGVKKIGFLKRSTGEDPSIEAAWFGGLDGDGNATGAPSNFDWSTLHSYRLFRDLSGIVKLYVDGEVFETLKISESDAPFLEELSGPFDTIQGSFFGSLSRPARSSSNWDFARYLILPTNESQTSASSFVSYEGNLPPEQEVKAWTPVGYHGTETILSSDFLLLDSTSATDGATSSAAGLIGGDFKGFVRLEPLLSKSSSLDIDIGLNLRTHTHGISPNTLMAAVDDGDRLMQLSFFSLFSAPKISYGGRSLPEDFSPYSWSTLGGSPAQMVGRHLRIDDTSTTDGRVYFFDDIFTDGSVDRVLSSSADYIAEFRVKVLSYTTDPSGFAGVFGHVFDGVRSVGIQFQELSGSKYVSFHSDGTTLGSSARFLFNWGDSQFHTYRWIKTTGGDLVSLFVDGVFLGSFAYSGFTASSPEPGGILSFGSSTPASSAAQSSVEWVYCNSWRVLSTQKRYIGLWKGYDPDSLTGYHLPTKVVGRQAQVAGNALGDSLANYTGVGVVAGDRLVVDYGSNKGTYEVAGVGSATTLTIVGTWPSAPSKVDYRIVKETDWTTQHKYRLTRDSDGLVSVFLDAVSAPLIQVGYNSLDLPASNLGISAVLANGLPSVVFGSFDPQNLTQSSWDYVRYGITVVGGGKDIAPHHQILNQWNVMSSPERLYTILPHELTSYKSSSTGIVPKKDPDFLADPGLRAFTVLNEGTPLVPTTQSFETRAPYTTQEYLSALSNPDDVLNSSGFTLNDGSVRYRLNIPQDILYTSLDVIEQQTGEPDLVAPIGDDCAWSLDSLQYTSEHCLEYTGATLPENDTAAPTSWARVSDNPAQTTASVLSGVLTYGTLSTGTRTVYRNDTPLPDHPSLRTETSFRLRLKQDGTFGTGDSQVRFGLSAPGFTVAVAFVTTVLAERFVVILDQNNGRLLGSASFDFLDGAFHTYRIVRDPGRGMVQVFIDV